jgi:hypothetical protein
VIHFSKELPFLFVVDGLLVVGGQGLFDYYSVTGTAIEGGT